MQLFKFIILKSAGPSGGHTSEISVGRWGPSAPAGQICGHTSGTSTLCEEDSGLEPCA